MDTSHSLVVVRVLVRLIFSTGRLHLVLKMSLKFTVIGVDLMVSLNIELTAI